MFSVDNPTRRFLLAAWVLLLLPLLYLTAACSGGGAASLPRAAVTIHPPPTATPAPTVWPATATPPPVAPAPPEDVAFTQIAAGKWHACGLREDATAFCWGSGNSYGEQNPPLVKFRQLAAGLHFTCGVRDGGSLVCWGDNQYGQSSHPSGEFAAVAAGRRHACALDATGMATCWGEGYAVGGEIEAGGAAFTEIGGGFGYSCGLTVGKDLLCWRNKGEPVITPGPFRVLAVGLHHQCALGEDGGAFCLGNNDSRQATPPPTAFTAIAAGWSHSCGITERGWLECWGSTAAGAAGQRLAAPGGEFTAISIGWRHSCGLRPSGYAECWYQEDVRERAVSLNLTTAFGGRGFDQPVDLFPWPGGGLAVVERSGTIGVYSDAPAGPPPRVALDLTANTDCCPGERGMLSAAVDPRFEEFPYLYVYYHARTGDDGDATVVGRLSRFPVVDGYARAGSELVMLEFYDPARHHHGGAVRFGPDGMLYLGIGDNRRSENAPDLSNLRGKIIRIDPRGGTAEQPYRAPSNNPFVNTPWARPEIWAYGLRNPWRMDFDRQGRLFVTDLGAALLEEVSIAVAGANMGWPVYEGNQCKRVPADLCADSAPGAVAPIHTYGRESGCAIIGGVTVPWLGDGFVFGDLCTGQVWLLAEDGAGGWAAQDLAQAPQRILSFSKGYDDTVYALVANSPILRLERSGAADPP